MSKDLTYDPNYLYTSRGPELSETIELEQPRNEPLIAPTLTRHDTVEKGIAAMPGEEPVGECIRSIDQGVGPYSNYDPGRVVFAYFNRGTYIFIPERYRQRDQTKTGNVVRTDRGLAEGKVAAYRAGGERNWVGDFKVHFLVSVYKAMVVASKNAKA
jgi:hypothetical protein